MLGLRGKSHSAGCGWLDVRVCPEAGRDGDDQVAAAGAGDKRIAAAARARARGDVPAVVVGELDGAAVAEIPADRVQVDDAVRIGPLESFEELAGAGLGIASRTLAIERELPCEGGGKPGGALLEELEEREPLTGACIAPFEAAELRWAWSRRLAYQL